MGPMKLESECLPFGQGFIHMAGSSTFSTHLAISDAAVYCWNNLQTCDDSAIACPDGL